MIKRFIVVEGPDRTGKTTLAKQIAFEAKALYIKLTCTPQLAVAMPEYHGSILDCVEWTLNNVPDTSVVMDRCWISEMIYGTILRYDLAKKFPYLEFERRFRALDAMYIMCNTDKIVDIHACDRDPAHPYTDEKFSMIAEAYRMFSLEKLSIEPERYITFDRKTQTYYSDIQPYL